DYFTRKKMGMARYVSYKNHSWEAKYPMRMLSYIAIITLSILTVAVLILFFQKIQERGRGEYIMAGAIILLTVLYVWYTLVFSREIQRSYYLVSALYGAAAFLQIVKAGTFLIRRRNEKNNK
ncbi:hypothetical protein, partial [Muricomes intestini]|uniref:hypothetical protein n=1 Tax=Muricomes intestini TaxID=1796634 RepID=UPI002FDE2249